MADFTHSFWSWYVAIGTLLGIATMVYLARVLSDRNTQAGADVGTSGHVWDENLEELNNPLPRWWLNLFYITLVWGFIYLLLYPGLGAFRGFLGWSQTNQYEREMATAEAQYGPLFAQYQGQDLATIARDPQAVEIGRRLFSTYCTTCHGSDAGGARGFPNLRDSEWLWGGTPAQIEASILEGRHGAMPPWGAVLGDAGVERVTAYVQLLGGQAADPKLAAAGAELYQTHCVVCHGAEGRGNPLLGAPDLTNDIWLHGGSTKKIAESIRDGRTGVMPPHREFLGADKAHVIAAYVVSLGEDAQ